MVETEIPSEDNADPGLWTNLTRSEPLLLHYLYLSISDPVFGFPSTFFYCRWFHVVSCILIGQRE